MADRIEAYAELEMGLYEKPEKKAEAEESEVSYQVDLQFNDPNNQAERDPKRGECRIDFAELLECHYDAQVYGERLAARVFADEAIRREYREAKAVVESKGRFLRLRLRVETKAVRLHSLRWEQLCDPDSHLPLATSERILFSRFLWSRDWRDVTLRPKTGLKALIAVAAPSNLKEYGLKAVDRAGEIALAREGLAGIEAEVAEPPLTLNGLIDRLRVGVDIVYLVCHGELTKELEPKLFLEDEDGKVKKVKGTELAERIGELAEPPRLMVLATCESAGKEDSPMVSAAEVKTTAAQAALAPRLAEAGVATIVAMQGKITMETVKRAMPVFFSELLKDGQIDRAMAAARGVVRERVDSWMPALFLRLREGRIWSEGASGGRDLEMNKRIAFAVVAAVLCVLSAAYPLVQWMRKPAPIMNQEIVIDTSEGMSAPFDNGPTKLKAAVEALRIRTLHPAENLALREFGGECHQDDGSRLLVSFGTNRREPITTAANALRSRGQPTLVSGVLSALADMQPLPNTKRIVVITGHADKCQEHATKQIKEHIEAFQKDGSKLSLEFRFIGLAVPGEDQASLQETSNAVGGQAHFVDTIAELNDVLEYVLEFEPAMIHVKKVWEVVDQVGRSIGDTAGKMNQREWDDAQKILDGGRAAFLKIKREFDTLAEVRLSVSFERFYKLGAENRSLQEQVFKVGRKAILQGKASGKSQTAEYQLSVQEWNKLVAKYNSNIYEMNKLTDEIAKKAPKSG